MFLKTVIGSITVFFIFSGVSSASISSSKNYKLHAGAADGGGMNVSSKSYSAENSVGGPLVGNFVSGANYKMYGGPIRPRNMIPELSIVNYNDGLLTTETTPTLSWVYSDKDGNPQRSYQLQVSKDNFATVSVDSELVSSDGTSYTTAKLTAKEGGELYRWRVRVNDGYDYSGWKVATNGFRLTSGAVEAPIIWAKTSIGGENIPSKLWQGCGNPYLYWEYPVTGVKIAGYSYAWGEAPDDIADTIGTSYNTPDDLLSDGIRVFNLKAANTAGNWSAVASFEIWIDRTSPTIGAYSPTNGAIISTDIPAISITVTDDKSGVNPDAINMKINKSTVTIAYDKNSQSVVYIPSVPLSEGDNVIFLEAADTVGNKTSPLVWSFVVDTKGPTGSIIINNEDATTNSVYVNLTLAASDSTSGVQSMVISNDGVFDNEQWEVFRARKDNWILPATNGTRKVYVKLRDTAGNESEIFNDTIELIIVAPDTIITSGPSLLTKSKDALFTFKATTDGCVFRWKFDNEEWTNWSTDTFITKKDLSEGNHYFKVQAAKDVNKNTQIDPDEIDPVPEERIWTISEKGAVSPDMPKKKPIKFWKEE